MPLQSPTDSVQVLVVGAGPVGLFAALSAAKRGLDVRVIDQAWRGYAPGRAALLHGRSLELLNACGVAERIRGAGRSVTELSLHVTGAPLVHLELPSPALAVPQEVLEAALLAALHEEKVELRAPYQAVTFDQSPGYVETRVVRRELVTLGSPAHYSEWEPVESSLVRADFVVGADGYDSRVRAALGIEPVTMGNTETFAMFEANSEGSEGCSAHLCLDDGLNGVMFPLPGARLRWGFQVREQLNEQADIDRLRALLSERASWHTAVPGAVSWGTVIHFERQLARRFGKNRVWLAGDAAHVTSPLGSQSMNAGLVEAADLAERMAQVARSGSGRDVLDNYGAEHSREWHKLLGVNVGFDLLPHAPPWLAAHARSLVPALPASGVELEAILERIGLRLS
jgi:2-polyprenyl-6-methoxyphenol hydroxylase-like FAD-dependent oxidoreductase